MISRACGCGNGFFQVGDSFFLRARSGEHAAGDVGGAVENGKACMDRERRPQIFGHLFGLYEVVVGPRLGPAYDCADKQAREHERYQALHTMNLRGRPLEWKAQFENPFAMPLFIEIPHACQQKIVERNHSHQLPGIAVDNGHPCESGLRHTINNDAQGLVRMRHNGIPHDLAQGGLRSFGLRESTQVLAGYHAADASFGIHHRK